MQTKLERDVRFLKIYAVCLTILVACLAAFGLCSSRKRHFKEMDVERINVREKSGKLDLVISNAERMPPAIINGKEYKNGMRSPGMLFYNGKGDEDGGMGFSSETTPDGKYHADGQLMFDQYNQDQAVGIQYNDNNGKRSAGLRVWDRPDVPIDKVMNQLEGLHGAERQATIKKLADDGMLGTSRVFVGKLPDKSAQVVLADTKSRPRLVMSVDASGAATINFLDENGKVTYSLPSSSPSQHRP